VRPPVQIWVAAPALSTENEGFRCFLFCFLNILDENAKRPNWLAPKNPYENPYGGKMRPDKVNFLARSFVLFSFLFERVPEDLTGPLHALLIGVGVSANDKM